MKYFILHWFCSTFDIPKNLLVLYAAFLEDAIEKFLDF